MRVKEICCIFPLWVSLLYSFPLFSKDSNQALDVKDMGHASNELVSQVQLSLKNLSSEIEKLTTEAQDIPERSQQILAFKIRISSLMNELNVLPQMGDRTNFTRIESELDKIEKTSRLWQEQVAISLQKINELSLLINQTFEVLANPSVSTSGLKGFENIPVYRSKAQVIKSELDDLLKVFEANKQHLKSLIDEISLCRRNLESKLQASLSQSLLRFEPAAIFTSPLISGRELAKDIQRIIFEIKGYPYEEFFVAAIGKLISLFLIFSILLLAFLKLMQKLESWHSKLAQKIENEGIAKAGALFFSKKYFLAAVGFIILFNFFMHKTSGTYPQIFLYVGYVIPLALFWWHFGVRIINFFIDHLRLHSSSGKHLFKVQFTPLFIFILIKSLELCFDIHNGVLNFFSSVIIGIVSFKLFLLVINFKFSPQVSEKQAKNIIIFMRSVRAFLVFFLAAIFLSVLIEILGLPNLGRSLQEVLVANLLMLAFCYLLYHLALGILDYALRSIKQSPGSIYKKEFLLFLQKGLSFIFLLSLLMLFGQSWASQFFITKSFSQLKLLSIGDWNLTVGMPIRFLFFYYSIKGVFILLTYLFDVYLLDQLNIERRYFPNFISALRYVFFFAFISIGIGILGFTYKNLIIFASALGVGIGFGLQNIVNNFISGIILLFERPVRVGDVIEVDGIFAIVRHIGIRSTIVEGMDNSNIVIPNSDIISTKLTNWTLNNNTVGVKCEVGVAYGTDTELVEKLLLEIAVEEPEVMKFPKPQVWFYEFGDSSLNFVIKLWIDRPMEKYMIKGRILHRINQAFKQHNITIPFPQRDVHLFDESKT